MVRIILSGRIVLKREAGKEGLLCCGVKVWG